MVYMLLRRTFLIFAIIAQSHVLANTNEFPPQSGVLSSASESVAIKTTPLKGSSIVRRANIGEPIYLNDEVTTGGGGKAQILLRDQSVFNIGPNSTLVIDKFIYDPQKSSLGVSIQKGTFKFVSGKIANSSNDAMKVQLPNATIAIRGTGVAGVVEPNGAATVMLLHGSVEVTSGSSNASSILTKSGWGVQINPAGVISPPAPIPADVSRNLMLSSRVSQSTAVAATNSSPTDQKSSSSQSSTPNSNSASPAAVVQLSADANIILTAPTSSTTVSSQSANSSGGIVGSSTIQSSTSGSFISSASSNLASTNATNALNSGSTQLSLANSNLSTAQTYASQAITQSANANSQKNIASSQASIASTQATLASNAALTLSADAIRAHELANTASIAASSAASSANSFSTSATSNANLAISSANSSSQSANSALGYANTAIQQTNSVINNAVSSASDIQTARNLANEAMSLSSQANSVKLQAISAESQASGASTSAQTTASQAAALSLAAASSALSAYQSASTVAQSLAAYETISQTIANSGVLNPLGNVTFSATNIAMSCINGINCGGTPSATINNHSFIFNFQNSTVTNNYTISYSNFNGYSGTISGNHAASAINWTNPTTVSLPVAGQVSANPVNAAMDVVLTSVGTQNLTNRANLATVFTSINSGTAYMGVGNGYKILGK